MGNGYNGLQRAEDFKSLYTRNSHLEEFCKTMLLKISQNSQETAATLLKKRFWHRCFPVNFEKFLRKTFLQNTFGGCFFRKNSTDQLLQSSPQSFTKFLEQLFSRHYTTQKYSDANIFSYCVSHNKNTAKKFSKKSILGGRIWWNLFLVNLCASKQLCGIIEKKFHDNFERRLLLK